MLGLHMASALYIGDCVTPCDRVLQHGDRVLQQCSLNVSPMHHTCMMHLCK